MENIGFIASILVILVLIGLTLYIYLGYGKKKEWTGLPKREEVKDAPSYVTLWGWLSLLIVPLTLALGGILFNAAQQQHGQDMEERRYQNDLRIQEKRAQDAALQAYLDKMSTLLLEHDLQSKEPTDKESTLAQAYTATLLDVAGPQHKGRVLLFLYRSNLVTKGQRKVDLAQTDLTEADLGSAYLWNADLSHVNFDGTRLSGAYLATSDMRSSILSNADLSRADLTGSVLKSADLRSANLTDSDLSGADLTPSRDNYDRPLPTRLEEADLKGARLDDTKLQGVDLHAVKNLNQDQIEEAEGDSSTQLPPNLREPESWAE
jgi:uncharacterized protein YjbI with pentapeptide repeats